MVYHVLADGTKLTDITGHVVMPKDAPAVYDLIHTINAEAREGKQCSKLATA